MKKCMSNHIGLWKRFKGVSVVGEQIAYWGKCGHWILFYDDRQPVDSLPKSRYHNLPKFNRYINRIPSPN